MATPIHAVPNPITAPRWFRHRWPWLLMLGPFAVVIAASFSAWLAFTYQDPLVTGDYYKKGKAINQDLRRDRIASDRGLKFSLDYDAAGAVLRGKVESLGAPDTEPVLL